jgi:hypothetical protein
MSSSKEILLNEILKTLNTISSRTPPPTPKPPVISATEYPEKCVSLMDKLILSIANYVFDSNNCGLKEILNLEKKVLKCYLKNAENPCTFTRFFQTVLITIQDTILQNSPDSVHIVSCMINKMMHELLKIQESVCCKSPHGCKDDKKCKNKKHDKSLNYKSCSCR